MTKNRLEAFSDGVMAIIITIMAFQIPLPSEITPVKLWEFGYNILVFFVSFTVVGAQWVKHHNLFCLCETVTPKVLWRNIFYLFVLSLLPSFTKWIMENPIEVVPAVAYNIVFLSVLIFFHLIQNAIIYDNNNIHFEQVRRHRSNFKRPWLFFVIIFTLIGVIFGVSVKYPTISLILYIAIPVVSSVINIWDERGDIFRRKRLKRHMKTPDS